MNEKLTSKEILEQFVQKSGLTEEQSKNFIDTFQYVFLQAIEQDKIVKISGLGTFQLVWNKPRKSVDVRTQQEIEIAGHYKLTFTPENALKERVNAEFAHLEPKEIEEPQSKKESPIEKLSQQAKELKGILDGIQQDNNKVETENISSEQVEEVEAEYFPPEQVEEITEEPKIEETIEEQNTSTSPNNHEEFVAEIVEEEKIEEIKEEHKNEAEIVIEEPIIEEKTEDPSDAVKRVQAMFEGKSVEEPKIETEIVEEKIITDEPKEEEKTYEQSAETEAVEDEKELAQKQSAIDFFYQKPQQPIEVKANTFNYIEESDFKPKKRRCWLWWLIILFVLAAAATAFYFLKPDLAKEYWNYTTDKATELTQKVSGWFSKSESADTEQNNIDENTFVVDSIQNNLDTTITETPLPIFYEPREYTEFITSVTMYGGNTLVKLSEKYYGNKVFWVYIYEANKNKIANPDEISAGQVIKIPKLDAKLIDSQNSACLEYAQNLHNQYIKR